MIANCTCKHDAQDMYHGKGRRVFNIGKTNAKCSVCGATMQLTSEQQKQKSTKK